MEQVVAFGPPPLPPKTRRSPPDAATVLASSADVFKFTSNGTNGIHQEVRHSEITTTKSSDQGSSGSHVVKIRINPSESVNSLHSFTVGDILCNSSANHNNELTSSPCIRINLNSDNEMIQNVNITDTSDRSFFYYSPFNCTAIMSSGQVSPSDTLDSGTCSDLDSTPPPPLPTKKNKSSCGVSVTVIGTHTQQSHKRAPSLTSSGADADSDDNESNISCDSLNSGEKPEDAHGYDLKECKASAFLPQGLLQDIRDRSVKLSQPNPIIQLHKEDEQHAGHDDEQQNANHQPHDDQLQIVNATTTTTLLTTIEEPDEVALVPEKQTEQQDAEDQDAVEEQRSSLRVIVEECTYEERRRQQVKQKTSATYETDKFISFHLNEMIQDKVAEVKSDIIEHDESFAGYKDLLQCDGSSTIRSAKGTIRGVKNRVRAGIATFLSINDQNKTYKEKDAGKVVVYTTTMGILRDTYNACMKVKQILRTQLVKFEERDVFMSTDYQCEIRERMRCNDILVPQVFVDGQHIGDAETIEKLNETGELRRILKPYKTMDACSTCKVCGGYNLLPCPVCNGSKKSVHRNHFTAEFVALKCMNCDEVGLVKCTFCAL